MRVFNAIDTAGFVVIMPTVGPKWIFPHTVDGWKRRKLLPYQHVRLVEWPEETWDKWRSIWGCPVDLDTHNVACIEFLTPD